jgi:Asp-tRNA(Asn)/Glu-tRNA(Gln) amidotransferase A subunit family amidase
VGEKDWPAASEKGPGFAFASTFDYARAYRDGETTPVEVASRVIAAVEASDAAVPKLRAVIKCDRDAVMRQAEASAARIKAGRPIGVLDGVPVSVKDELDMTPYTTSVGTSFLGKEPAKADATSVARLRAAGALMIGKTNMHEIGIGVTGLNPHFGTPRNPYNTGHYTGGSSSGSAAAVAAGFSPIALGADGGGSVRVPASFCGVVGLKPTFGRVSEIGAAPLCWSVAHVGPLAATVADAALAYAVIAGPDPLDANSLHQPPPEIRGWDNIDLNGLRLGVYRPWFEHAEAQVVAACEELLRRLVGLGARVVDVEIHDLEAARVAHTLTIAGEMSQSMQATYAEHRKDHGLDVRINLALSREFRTFDYVKAQRIRTRAIANFNRALDYADVIITPTSGVAAPRIPSGALPDGESDLSTLVEIMRFATPGNLTGLPAITFPAGYTTEGLPVGMQAMGRAWDEKTLLRLALAAEKVVERKAPQVHYRLM